MRPAPGLDRCRTRYRHRRHLTRGPRQQRQPHDLGRHRYGQHHHDHLDLRWHGDANRAHTETNLAVTAVGAVTLTNTGNDVTTLARMSPGPAMPSPIPMPTPSPLARSMGSTASHQQRRDYGHDHQRGAHGQQHPGRPRCECRHQHRGPHRRRRQSTAHRHRHRHRHGRRHLYRRQHDLDRRHQCRGCDRHVATQHRGPAHELGRRRCGRHLGPHRCRARYRDSGDAPGREAPRAAI